MLTREIPDSAHNIVTAIRREVPHPTSLPELKKFVFSNGAEKEAGLRWPPGINPMMDGRCPMGLLKDAPCDAPSELDEFRKFSSFELKVFGSWWDEQRDAQAAVDAVWGIDRTTHCKGILCMSERQCFCKGTVCKPQCHCGCQMCEGAKA